MCKTSIESEIFKPYWPKSCTKLFYVTWMKSVDNSISWFIVKSESYQILSFFTILKVSITFLHLFWFRFR